MRTLYYRFKTASDFIAKSLSSYPHGGLFASTVRGVQQNEMVMLDITIDAVHGHYIFRAGVAKLSASFSDGGKERSGMELEFLAEEQFLIQPLLDDLASAGPFKARANKRINTSMRITFSLTNRTIHAPILDFGPGGFFLPDIPGVLPGDLLRCRLTSFDKRVDQETAAEICWAGEKDNIQGLGGRFIFDSKKDQKRWKNAFYTLQKPQEKKRFWA